MHRVLLSIIKARTYVKKMKIKYIDERLQQKKAKIRKNKKELRRMLQKEKKRCIDFLVLIIQWNHG